ncbi:MAG: CRISPR-associated ring nuclease Crn1 [Candidatus Aramenus sulfurataquae]|jgi:CRISPR-associated protein Csx14|nr:CRISPR-associated ring nuclease Crn1 [Candidatus Aramenus sulfurataquae]
MTKLVCTLGTSPGGIFETYKNLRGGNYEVDKTIANATPIEINEVYVIRTSDKAVEFAWKLVKAIFACCREKGDEVTIADIPIPIQDITSPNDFKKFKNAILPKISVGDYVDFTGGRKAMSVAAALSAREVGAHVVTTIIPQGEYSGISKIIEELKGKEDLVERAGNGDCESIRDTICKLISNEAKTIMLY